MLYVNREQLRRQHGGPVILPFKLSAEGLDKEYLPRTYRNGNVVGIEMQREGVRYVLNAGGEFKRSKTRSGSTWYINVDDVEKVGFIQLVRQQMVADSSFCEQLVTDPRFSNIYEAVAPSSAITNRSL